MKRIVSVLLAILLLASFIPVSAVTTDVDVVTENTVEAVSEISEEIVETVIDETSSEEITDETVTEETVEETVTEESKHREKDSDIADTGASKTSFSGAKIDPTSVFYGDKIKVTGRLLSGISGINSKTVYLSTSTTVTDDTKLGEATTQSSGMTKGHFTIEAEITKDKFPTKGANEVYLVFSGDSSYNASNTSLSINISEPEQTLSISMKDSKLTRDETTTLTVSHKIGNTDIVDDSITYDLYEVLETGEEIPVDSSKEKTFTIDSMDYEVGTHQLVVKSSGSDTYDDKESDPVSFSVSKITPAITIVSPLVITKTSKQFGETFTISGTFTNGLAAIKDETLSIRVNDPESDPIYTCTTGALGFEAEIPVTVENFPDGIGDYTVYVCYDGSDIYNKAESKSRDLEIKKGNTTLSVTDPLLTNVEKAYGDTLTVEGYLTGGILSGINGQEVKVRLADATTGTVLGSDVTAEVSGSNGKFSIDIPVNKTNFPDSSKQYTLYVCYDGDENHNGASPITKKLNITVVNTQLNVVSPLLPVTERGFGDTLTVAGTLTSKTLQGINGQEVKVRVGDPETGKVVASATTEEILSIDGSFSIDVLVDTEDFPEAKDYTLYVCYDGDDGHVASAPISKTLRVSKTSTTVSCDLDDLIIKRPDGSTTLHVSYKAGDEEITDTDITYTVYAQGTGTSIFAKTQIAESTSKDIKIPAKALPAGVYNITVKASGNNTYKEAESKILDINVLTILKTDSQINGLPLTISDKEYGDYITFVGYLTDKELLQIIPKGINGETIHVRVGSPNGKEIATAETKKALVITNGEFNVTIPVSKENFPDGPGEYKLYFCFDGNDDYYPSNLERTFEITKTDTTVIAELDLFDHIIYRPDEKAQLTIHYLDGLKEIKDDDIIYTVFEIVDGEEKVLYEGPSKRVDIEAKDLKVGLHNLKVRASGNDTYKEATSKDITLITVAKTDTYINDVPLLISDKEYGDTIILSGNLEDGLLFADGINGKTINAHIDSADGPVVATADTSKVLFKDGHFVIEIPVDLDTFDAPGEYEIILTFDGDDDYNSAIARTFVEIKKIDTTITDLEVTPEDTRLWKNDIITVKATLNDDLREETVEGEKIAFYYVNQLGNSILMGIGETDEDGVATITYNTRFIPFEGEYDVVAVYYGDDEFNPTYETLDSAFTIHNPEIVSVDVPEDDVLIYGNPELTEAAFDVVFDDFIDRSDNVYYTIYGKDGAIIKSSQEIIGDSGSIIADLSDLDAGDYTIAVIAVDESNGHNAYYWNRADFTIAKADTNLDVTFENNNVKYSKDNNVITATLTDQFGNPIADKEVTITVESKDGEHKYTYTGTTDENGVFSVTLEPVDFVPSEYTVSASYEAAEEDNYNSCEGASEENLVVNKLDVTFSIEVIDDGHQVIFKLVAKDELGNPVSNEDFTVALGDKYIGTITTGEDGTGTLKVSKRITGTGKFELNVAFAGNDYLSSASSSNPIVITQSHRGHHRHNGAAVQTGSQNLAILFLVIAIIALALIPMMVYKKRSSRK